jgi:hypothetical protein
VNGRALVALALVLGLVAVVVGAWLVVGRKAPGPRAAESNPCDAFPSLNGALTAWMQDWRRLEPALTCEHFEESAKLVPPVAPEAAWEDPSAIAVRAPRRWLAPDGRRLLVPAGPELALVDLESRTRRVVLSGGPGTDWRDAGWTDARGFVVAGERPGEVEGVSVPTLTVVRLEANRATEYRGPAVPRAALDALQRPTVLGGTPAP